MLPFNGPFCFSGVDVNVFKCLILWLYTKQYDEFVLSKRYNGIKGYILLYALAAKLEVNSFGNHHGVSILPKLRRDLFMSGTLFNNEEILYVYEHWTAEHPLRVLVLELTTYACLKLQTPMEDFTASLEGSRDFNTDFIKKLIEGSRIQTLMDPRNHYSDFGFSRASIFDFKDQPSTTHKHCEGSEIKQFRPLALTSDNQTEYFHSVSSLARYHRSSFEVRPDLVVHFEH